MLNAMLFSLLLASVRVDRTGLDRVDYITPPGEIAIGGRAGSDELWIYVRQNGKAMSVRQLVAAHGGVMLEKPTSLAWQECYGSILWVWIKGPLGVYELARVEFCNVRTPVSLPVPDFDGDGDADQTDFGLLQVQLGGGGQYDLTNDGRVDRDDIEMFAVLTAR